MEFVDGMDIHQYLSEWRQVVSGAGAHHHLPCAQIPWHMPHGNGIVHRDIKPANILLNHEGRVKIADFSSVKQFTAEGGNTCRGMTSNCFAVGTRDFLAPEAMDGTQRPDHRADLYA